MWWQRLAFVVGLWLMAAPAVLGLEGSAADALHVLGPLAAAVGFVAASEITRGLRRLNLLTGVALLLAPLPLGFGPAAIVASLLSGAVLICLSFLGGRTSTRFGGGWRSLIH